MLSVALTGGIATGKSYVLQRFRSHGVPCLEADRLAHGVTAAGTEATAAIAARFGQDVLAADGSVDRRKLGSIVFADPAARRELEAMTHPAVFRAIVAGLRAFALTGCDPLAIVEIPLLFETGRESEFDRVVVVACTPARQIARLLARGLSEAEARQRLAAQWPIDRKVERAEAAGPAAPSGKGGRRGFVIRTDGTFEESDRQTDVVLQALMATSA